MKKSFFEGYTTKNKHNTNDNSKGKASCNTCEYYDNQKQECKKGLSTDKEKKEKCNEYIISSKLVMFQ